MAVDIAGGFGLLGGAVADFFGSKGQEITAGGYRQAAGSYRTAAALALQDKDYSEQSTKIQLQQADRKIYQTIGGQQADVAGAGFQASGTALDLLRDSTAQGEMTMNILALQGKINSDSWLQQSHAYNAQADAADAAAAAAEAASEGSFLGGILKFAGAAAKFAPFFL